MTAEPALGRVGVWSFELALAPADQLRPAVERIEELGYGALWFPEVPFGRESLSLAATLLGWSERLVVATGIAQIFARDAVAAENGARTLCEAHPGRFLLGLGVSHAPTMAMRGAIYDKPLAAMRAYLDAMDAAPFLPGAFPAPRVLAALAPKMLAVAATRALGSHTYFVPPEHTAVARAALDAAAAGGAVPAGRRPLLLVEQAAVLDTAPSSARAVAREHMGVYLGLPNYCNNLLRLGYPQADLDGAGSDRLVDEIVAWGDAAAIRARVDAHFAAGADHVAIQLLHPAGTPIPLAGLAELAPALLSS